MGRPMLKICAKKGCEATDCTDPAQQEGVDFSVQVCFFRGLDSKSESEVLVLALADSCLAGPCRL